MREQLQGQHLSTQTRGGFGVCLQTTKPDGQTMTGFESWRGTLYNTDSALWIPVSSCSEKKDHKANPFPWSSANSTVLLLERLYFDISITESFSCQLGATQIECGIVEWFSNSIRHLGSLHFLSKKEVLLFIYLSADGSCCTSQSIAQ